MKTNTKWLIAGAVAVVIAAAVVMTTVIQTAKDIELNDEQIASLTHELTVSQNDETAYQGYHIKYYGSKWADCSTRLFIVATCNEFFIDKSKKGFHHYRGASDIMVVDTVIDGDDVKIKDFDLLTDLGFEEPEAKVRAKIPKEIYKKMELEDPDKYLKEDTAKARAYFRSME